MEIELLFDEDLMIMEMHDMEYFGTGRIQDPETGKIEMIHLLAPINTVQIIL